jgi:hypothetical protein
MVICTAAEAAMQKYPKNLSEAERRLARRWTLGSLAVYGSILGGLILYATLGRNSEIDVAAGTAAAISAAVGVTGSTKP